MKLSFFSKTTFVLSYSRFYGKQQTRVSNQHIHTQKYITVMLRFKKFILDIAVWKMANLFCSQPFWFKIKPLNLKIIASLNNYHYNFVFLMKQQELSKKLYLKYFRSRSNYSRKDKSLELVTKLCQPVKKTLCTCYHFFCRKRWPKIVELIHTQFYDNVINK